MRREYILLDAQNPDSSLSKDRLDHNKVAILANHAPVIFAEDNHLLGVLKPFGMSCMPDSITNDALSVRLQQYLKVRYNKPKDAYLGVLHRLDRATGGVMLFAKTSKAAARVSEQFAQRRVEKYYLAVLHGSLKMEQSVLTHWHNKDSKNRMAILCSYTKSVAQPEQARLASLSYRLLSSADNLSCVLIKLDTGRFHQIRAQFASIGNPVFGDIRYGGTLNASYQGVGLWSYQLAFEHPTLKQTEDLCWAPPNVYPWTLFNHHFTEGKS